MDLVGRFGGLFEKPSTSTFGRLAKLYGEPARRYHTMAHIEDCLQTLDAAQHRIERRTIEFALWWHDAIYDARRSDNEALSAVMAIEDLRELGVGSGDVDEVARLILLTKGHTVESGDDAGALMVSIDLSILGRDSVAYDRYAAQIWEEYIHVPEELYRAGRAAILSGFLEGDIFPDAALRAQLETQARVNLTREISTLSA